MHVQWSENKQLQVNISQMFQILYMSEQKPSFMPNGGLSLTNNIHQYNVNRHDKI